MITVFRRLIGDEDGQGVTEYALIMAFVVLLVFFAYRPLSSSLNIFFGRVVDAFQNASGTAGLQQLAPVDNWDQGPIVFKA